jgi:hypothetical protein
MGYGYSIFKVELTGTNHMGARVSHVHDVTAATANEAIADVRAGALAVGFDIESISIVAGPLRRWWGGDF